MILFSWPFLLFFDKGGADCVTYFDKDARYKLLYVGREYYIYDSYIERSISPKVKYYIFFDNCVYAICEDSSGASMEPVEKGAFVRENYFMLNVITGEKRKFESMDEIDSNIKSMYQKENMIDLTKNLSAFYEWFSDFIPSFMRKR